MGRKFEELLDDARTLPETERATLAALLIDSLDPSEPGVEKAWAEEIEGRIRQLDSGEVKTIPWSDVRRGLLHLIDEAR